MTRPKNISRTTVVKSTLSKASFFAMRRPSQKILDQALEDLAAVHEVPELVEAGAGRGQDHDLARPRLAGGGGHGAVHGPRRLVGDGRAQGLLEIGSRLADEVGPARLAPHQGLQ